MLSQDTTYLLLQHITQQWHTYLLGFMFSMAALRVSQIRSTLFPSRSLESWMARVTSGGYMVFVTSSSLRGSVN